MKRHKSVGLLSFTLISAFLGLFIVSGCSDYYQPKPRGYFRIYLPQKEYTTDSTLILPYSFEQPVYARLVKDPHPMAEDYWTNLDFPAYKAKVHLSYKPVNGNLAALLDDAHKLVNKHIPKANAINENVYIDNTHHVYGITYSIKGVDAASPFQFYLTDSTRHFLRGALYFDVRPNNDSLAPVIDFIDNDIRHMIETFRWKKIDNK